MILGRYNPAFLSSPLIPPGQSVVSPNRVTCLLLRYSRAHRPKLPLPLSSVVSPKVAIPGPFVMRTFLTFMTESSEGHLCRKLCHPPGRGRRPALTGRDAGRSWTRSASPRSPRTRASTTSTAPRSSTTRCSTAARRTAARSPRPAPEFRPTQRLALVSRPSSWAPGLHPLVPRIAAPPCALGYLHRYCP